MLKNRNLTAARAAKNDEFYTRGEDIAGELQHYKPLFADKTVLCNCDDPRFSNFVKFFFAEFKNYRLKRLLATGYRQPDSSLGREQPDEAGIAMEYAGAPKIKTLDEVPLRKLRIKNDFRSGDFRSAECKKYLARADIVVSNPPFSLFRQYIDLLTESEKKFLIIGNFNAINYKSVFPLVRDNKIWVGVSRRSMNFLLADGSSTAVNACWFTNLPHAKRNKSLSLQKRYSEDAYPKYEGYDIINVDQVKDIPQDYSGEMGVPITFFDKYNPAQFEIVGRLLSPRVQGSVKYTRILIKHKQISAGK